MYGGSSANFQDFSQLSVYHVEKLMSTIDTHIGSFPGDIIDKACGNLLKDKTNFNNFITLLTVLYYSDKEKHCFI